MPTSQIVNTARVPATQPTQRRSIRKTSWRTIVSRNFSTRRAAHTDTPCERVSVCRVRDRIRRNFYQPQIAFSSCTVKNHTHIHQPTNTITNTYAHCPPRPSDNNRLRCRPSHTHTRFRARVRARPPQVSEVQLASQPGNHTKLPPLCRSCFERAHFIVYPRVLSLSGARAPSPPTATHSHIQRHIHTSIHL